MTGSSGTLEMSGTSQIVGLHGVQPGAWTEVGPRSVRENRPEAGREALTWGTPSWAGDPVKLGLTGMVPQRLDPGAGAGQPAEEGPGSEFPYHKGEGNQGQGRKKQ